MARLPSIWIRQCRYCGERFVQGTPDGDMPPQACPRCILSGDASMRSVGEILGLGYAPLFNIHRDLPDFKPSPVPDTLREMVEGE